MIALELPWPPTINHYYRNTKAGIFLGKSGRLYRAEVLQVVKYEAKITKPLESELEMAVKLFPPNRRSFDLDNRLKALLDAMEHAGVYCNDRQIRKLYIEDTGQLGGFAEVYINPMVSHETKIVACCGE